MFPRSTLSLLALLALPHAAPAATRFELRSTIAFTSTRDNLALDPTSAAEIYLCDADGTNVRRITENTFGDGFPALSPDGRKIVFDSARNRPPGLTGPFSELFVMETDGNNQTLLLRGSSGAWSPDSKNIAFHASASGTGTPIRNEPGAPATDSDIFTLNVDDWLDSTAVATNITNTPSAIEDDADWSPDGQSLIFTSHPTTDSPTNPIHAEIYQLNADGTGLTALTSNLEEERAPSWAPDGTKVVFMARKAGPDFEICTMNADGSGVAQLTNNSVTDATPTFSPDGQKIVFHRLVGVTFQLFQMNADGTGAVQMTTPPGLNLFANWGELRVKAENAARSLARSSGAGGLSLRLASSSPARGAMSFRFALPADGAVRLAIYDIQGRRVATVLDQTLAAGSRTARWDGRDIRGKLVASGAYFAKLEAAGEVQMQKLLVAR
jgi:TolB protein